MRIQNVNDESFKKYGKVLTGYHVDGILKEMEHTPLTRDVVYVPSVEVLEALMEAYTKKYGDADIYECPICIVESEIHMVQALEEIKAAGCNALVVYLGNFGPEISETLLAKHFEGPKMFVAAAEERGDNLIQGRGDAYCGMLNASYNLKLRKIQSWIFLRHLTNMQEMKEFRQW